MNRVKPLKVHKIIIHVPFKTRDLNSVVYIWLIKAATICFRYLITGSLTAPAIATCYIGHNEMFKSYSYRGIATITSQMSDILMMFSNFDPAVSPGVGQSNNLSIFSWKKMLS